MALKRRGRFITFEGGEGAGKSTQIQRLRAWLEDRGQDVVVTREPGGTDGAEAIRELVLSGDAGRWHPMTELLLMMAARSDHLQKKIRPALNRGETVLCDRFFDSSRVYQGIAGSVGLDAVDRMHEPLLREGRPDVTILLDLDPQAGLSRRSHAGGGSRFEAKKLDFHQAVRKGFLELAQAEPGRFRVIDASLPEDQVHQAIVAAVQS